MIADGEVEDAERDLMRSVLAVVKYLRLVGRRGFHRRLTIHLERSGGDGIKTVVFGDGVRTCWRTLNERCGEKIVIIVKMFLTIIRLKL